MNPGKKHSGPFTRTDWAPNTALSLAGQMALLISGVRKMASLEANAGDPED